MAEGASSSDAKHRVKLYRLNQEEQWLDMGTGNVFAQMSTRGDTWSFHVRSESGTSMLIEHTIDSSIEYQKQSETILVWRDPDTQKDVALSFQLPAGCTELWDKIQHSLQASSNVLVGEEIGLEREESAEPPFNLPVNLDRSHLEELANTLPRLATYGSREIVLSAITKDNYLQKIVTLFHRAEEADDDEALRHLFVIVRSLFMLNDSGVFEQLFSEQHFLGVLGALEYDPDLAPDASHRQHREFVTNALFKEVLTVRDKQTLDRIHRNYRMSYVKDVVLLRYFDDATLGSLNTLIFYNNMAIVQHFLENPQYLQQMISKMRTYVSPIPKPDKSTEGKIDKEDSKKAYEASRKDVYGFVKELVSVARTLHQEVRSVLHKQLAESSFLSVLEDAVCKVPPDSQIYMWLLVVDILSSLDPAIVRAYFATRVNAPDSLLGCLLSTVVLDSMSSCIGHQLVELLKVLLDPNPLDAEKASVAATAGLNSVLDHLYRAHMDKLTTALVRPPGPRDPLVIHSGKYHALELLSFFVSKHGSRIKTFSLKHNLLQKVSQLIPVSGRELQLSAIRFLRVCVGMKDDQLIWRIVSGKLLDPVVAVFVKNGSRYNMVNSAFIEMVEFIRKENLKDLVDYLAVDHMTKFDRVKYVSTFQQLKLRYDQNQEFRTANGVFSDSDRGEEKERLSALFAPRDKADESYFTEEDSDEENTQPAGDTSAAAAVRRALAAAAAAAVTSPTSADGAPPVPAKAGAVASGSGEHTGSAASAAQPGSPSSAGSDDDGFVERWQAQKKKEPDDDDFLSHLTDRSRAGPAAKRSKIAVSTPFSGSSKSTSNDKSKAANGQRSGITLHLSSSDSKQSHSGYSPPRSPSPPLTTSPRSAGSPRSPSSPQSPTKHTGSPTNASRSGNTIQFALKPIFSGAAGSSISSPTAVAASSGSSAGTSSPTTRVSSMSAAVKLVDYGDDDEDDLPVDSHADSKDTKPTADKVRIATAPVVPVAAVTNGPEGVSASAASSHAAGSLAARAPVSPDTSTTENPLKKRRTDDAGSSEVTLAGTASAEPSTRASSLLTSTTASSTSSLAT